MPAAVALAAMSGVEGVRAEEARQGAGQDGPPSSPRQDAESKTPARTPGSAAAKPSDTEPRSGSPFARNDASLRGEGDGCRLPSHGTGAASEAEQASPPYEAEPAGTKPPKCAT